MKTAAEASNLAALYKAETRYGEAEALYRRALSLRQQSLGTFDADVASSMNNVGEILRLYLAPGSQTDPRPALR